MYCNQCNLEFPEGLRYCKWCGQELAKSRRVTSELRSCSACSAAIHPDWTFCKACGVRLVSTAPEPATAICGRCGAGNDPSSLYCSVCGESLLLTVEPEKIPATSQPATAVIHRCESCGEHLEAHTGYCKMCGAAVQTAAQPFGASSLLCGQCQSYSPIGSSACRVCGASLAGEGEEAEPGRSSTLPDLAERMPNPEAMLTQMAPGADSEAGLPDKDIVKSGEQTAIFPEPEKKAAPPPEDKPVPPRSAFETVETRIPFLDMKPKGGAETGVLPGVAGASSDQVSTTHLNQGRTTGPVDPSEEGEQAPASQSLSAPPSGPSQASPSTELITSEPSAPVEDKVEDKNATVESEVRLTQSIHGTDESAATGFNSSMPTAAQGDGFTAPFGLNSSALERSWQDGEKTRNISQPETETLPAGSATDSQPTGRTDTRTEKPTVEVPSLQERGKTESFYGEPHAQVPETAVLGESFKPTRAVEVVPVETAYEPPPQKRNNLPMILSVIAGLILIGAAAFAFWWYTSSDPRTRSQAQPPAEQPPVTAPQAPTPAPTVAAPSAPEGMVLVASGTYAIGRDVKGNYESPAHSVTLPAFYIDRTEVTNAAYKKFIDATGHAPPGGWKGGTFPEGLDNHPVTGVSWQDAVDYATWAGKRLPMEEEWEAAARGSEGRLYPWGDEWKPDLANIGTKSTREVGQFPGGVSPAGALDMIGNVWEWTSDEFHLYPGNTEEAPENIKQPSLFRIIRGGAYDGSKIHTATYRGFVEADSREYNKTGFRCAKSAAGNSR